MASESDSPKFKSCSPDDHQSIPAKTSSPFRISVSLGANVKSNNTSSSQQGCGAKGPDAQKSVVNLAQGKGSLNLNSFPSNGFAKLALC